MKEDILNNLSHLPEKSRNVITSFSDVIIKGFNDKLYSLILFGSASGKNFIENKSDINIMIILEKVTVSDLEAIMEAGRKYAKNGLGIPLVFERGHVVTSLDTFPIEFSDMKEHHVLLHGTDPLQDAIIEKKNLRYQCEHEFKAALVNLRRGYMRTGGERENIEALLESSLSSVVASCRGMIWLAGKNPADNISDLLKEIEELYKTDTTAIDRVWRLHQGQSGASALLESLFEDYIANIASLAAVVDKL